jgi:O-antigen ligase
MLVWLLNMSDSQTSTACLLVVAVVMLLSRTAVIEKKPSRLVPLVATLAMAFAMLNSLFGLRDQLLGLMGRDSTLTNRAELWAVVKSHEVNPLVGAGFMTFWAGERMGDIWREVGAMINQAHNGYLEQYLNLGYVGVAFIITIMSSGLLSVRHHLDRDPAPALLRLSFLVAAALYNYTEASFYGLNNMWVLMLAASIDPAGAMTASSRVFDSDVPARPSRSKAPGRLSDAGVGVLT